MPEAIRRGREESKSPPLEVLGVFSLAPSATLSFHKENSVIAEGLVLLREGILEASELEVLCFWHRSSGPRHCPGKCSIIMKNRLQNRLTRVY